MATVVLRVEEPLPDDGGYPVSLLCTDADGLALGAQGAPAPEVRARGVIAKGLLTAPCPVEVSGDESPATAVRRALLRKDGTPNEVVQAVGLWLHKLLDHAGVGEELRKLRPDLAEDVEPGMGLRLLLDLRAREIGHLPWELVVDGTDSRRPFSELPNPAARITHRYGGTDKRHDWWWPLKLLVVVGASATDPHIKAENELTRLEDALSSLCPEVDMEVLEQPTKSEVLAELEQRRPHILHFIGHGDHTKAGGRLVFDLGPEHEPQTRWWWRADEIGTDLTRSPRVVVLNCCRTDVERHQEGGWQVADAFAARGVPAVISMQGPIPDPDALAFSTAFYTALANGEPFDVAFTRGRREIAASRDDGWRRRETYFPTLTLNQPAQSILPPRWIAGPEVRLRVKELEQPLRPGLVDRRKFRHDLLSKLDIGPDSSPGDAALASPPPNLLGITGHEGMGKTALVRWAIARQAQRGRQAVYVDLGDDECGWLKFVRRTAAAMQKSLSDRGPTDAFVRDLNALVQLEYPPSEDPPGPVDIADHPFIGRHSEISMIFASLLIAMRRTAHAGPLVLAIDPLHVVADEDLERYIFPALISQVATGAAGDTRLLLVRRGNDLGLPEGDPYTIHVKPFETANERELRSLIRQYLLLRELDTADVDAKEPMVMELVKTGNPVSVMKLLGAVVETAA